MCALAAMNGETIIRPHHNCNWNDHDQSKLKNQHLFTSCATRRQAFDKKGATWGQIEREIHNDDFCDGFEYGIMLRDPLDHAVSMTRFEKLSKAVITQHVACLRARSCKGTGFHVFDNFMIRMMLGEAGLNIEPGGVTREHVKTVVDMIEKFDVVTTLDNFQDILPSKLGWHHTSLHKKKARGFHNRISDQDLQFIYENTMMDRTVFEHFGGLKKSPDFAHRSDEK